MADSGRYFNARNTTIAAIAITLLGGYYVSQSPSSSAMSQTSSEVPGLSLSLAQVSKDPATVRVTLKNNHPDTPYSLLKWGTPLDAAALNTGVFKINNADSGAEVEQVIVQIRRKMPPGQNQLASVEPGAEESVEVVFDRPWMPEAKPAKYKVKAEGTLWGVWDKVKSEVTDDDTNEYTDSPLAGRTYATNEIELVVE
ncbi:uncharacterized protein EKO05_0007887 [Ascochyta rabiei]|uniref:Uncharacterized protein n=1 Tax=Didymella rabiei TaxID=5454 RepID=A0A163BW49_DIDRA|nr:uncharacterized protein EKO05_0007887 [Ascochyta rabiei]KZM22044.1 hypothetical protein ST47_g6771 [Ascochyta rabiei]UPX17538.1 hypothetical protein EKO05_0007887 [Ascochyta rabiei]